MMNLAFSIIVVTIILLAYLLVGLKSRDNSATDLSADAIKEKEVRAFVSQYEQDKAALADLSTEEYALRLAELEARLYNELKPIIQKNQRNTTSAPLWAYVVVIFMVFSALAGWYFYNGHYVWQWQQLDSRMDSALTRSQFLDELPQDMPPEIMSTYCLALQNRVDRNDLNQLDTLAQCMAGYGNYPGARDVYEYIYRKNPADTANIVSFAQMSLFSSQGQPLARNLEQALHDVWSQEPDNYMAGVLLASSYTQSGANEQASIIWQQLLNTMPPDHPLYELVLTTYQRTAAHPPVNMNNDAAQAPTANAIPATPTEQQSSAQDHELNIAIYIPADMIADLPSQSRLFVLASPENSRMPIAVKRLEIKENQNVTLNNQDSMQGQSLSDFDKLNVRAIISLDGQANGNSAQARNEIIDLAAAPSSTIQIEFDFSTPNAAP